MTVSNEQFILRLENNYQKVFNYTAGQPNLQTCISIAVQYTMVNREYSGVAQQKIVDAITQKEPSYSMFWTFRTNAALLPKVASYLLLSDDLDEELLKASKGEELLAQVNFDKSPYRSLASFFVDDLAHANRTKRLHTQLKKRQPFLTRSSDLPYLVLLTKDGENNELARAESIQLYYKALQKLGFKMGDALQALAQLLTLYKASYVEDLANYIAQLKKEFELRGIKITRKYYPYVGVLAIQGINTGKVEEITTLTEQLANSRALKGVKEFAFIIAVQKFVYEQRFEQFTDATITKSSVNSEWLYIFSDLIFYFPHVALDSIGSIMDFDFSL